MKINSVHQSDAISKYMNSVPSKTKESPKSAGISDSVELSEGAQKYASLMKAAKDEMANSGIDEDIRAADIIAQMNQNAYNVPADAVVGSILKGYPSNV